MVSQGKVRLQIFWDCTNYWRSTGKVEILGLGYIPMRRSTFPLVWLCVDGRNGNISK